MNGMMMLERGRRDKDAKDEGIEVKLRQTTKIVGERDPLRGTARARPIELQNKHDVIQADVDSDDEGAGTDGDTTRDDADERVQSSGEETGAIQSKRHRPHKRQRQRRKEIITAVHTTNASMPAKDIWYITQRRPRPRLPQRQLQPYAQQFNEHDEAARDAAAADKRCESDWFGLGVANGRGRQTLTRPAHNGTHNCDNCSNARARNNDMSMSGMHGHVCPIGAAPHVATIEVLQLSPNCIFHPSDCSSSQLLL